MKLIHLSACLQKRYFPFDSQDIKINTFDVLRKNRKKERHMASSMASKEVEGGRREIVMAIEV
jgi:hypothetical protein